jgi:hypothetical protein
MRTKNIRFYRRVGVPEVWFWEDGIILINCLRDEADELVSGSELLTELDIRSIKFHTRVIDQYNAVNQP